MSTVLYLFDLKADIDPAAYEAWAASGDLPTLNSLPSVRGYRILRTRVPGSSPANPAQPASYVELVDVTSGAQFHADMARRSSTSSPRSHASPGPPPSSSVTNCPPPSRPNAPRTHPQRRGPGNGPVQSAPSRQPPGMENHPS